jgi:flavin reductase (DIM6/NTAB) family NADH-FMN oxidoreductase RutF
MESLPEWPDGTVAILSTGAGAPHAIPVSTCVRAGPRTVLLALAQRRESLARLREDPRCALSIIGAGDVAVTAHARATILRELSDAVVAVRLDVERIQDHGQPTFAIEEGVRWRWIDEEARERDARIREALRELGRVRNGGG